MSNNVSIPRIKKISRGLRITINVFLWVLVIGTVLLFAAGIALNFLSEDIFMLKETRGVGFVLSMDGLIRYNLDESSLGISIRPIYQTIAYMATLGAGTLAIILKKLADLLKTIENDEPFAGENSKHLTVIGAVLLVGSFGFRIIGAIVANTMIETLHITHIDVNASIDIFMAMTGLLVLILAAIFKYGNYLQKEYDSTL